MRPSHGGALKKYMSPRKTTHNQVLVNLGGSAPCDKILAAHPSDFALLPDAADDLIATCFIYLPSWYDVSMHFKHDDVPLFVMTGRGHLLMHSRLLSRCQVEVIGPLYITCVLSFGLTNPICSSDFCLGSVSRSCMCCVHLVSSLSLVSVWCLLWLSGIGNLLLH